MPVWLDAIPEKAAKVSRPDTRRWLLCLIFIMLVGIVLTFWNWTTERTGFIFWFTALGLPFCFWGLFFSLRRFMYKAEHVAAHSRNVERDALIDREIHRGQRCAWLLGYHIQHFSGNKPSALVKTISRAIPVAEVSTPRGTQPAIRYAALTVFQTDLDAELTSVISTLAARIQKITERLPMNISCYLMLDCDNDIQERVKEQLRNKLAVTTGRVFHLIAEKGLTAFDAWLDKRWNNPGIFAAVTLSLPAQPNEGDADAITLVVASNRRLAEHPDAICLHRPEKGRESTLGKTLHRSLLWAAVKPEALKAGWHTGPAIARGAGWNKACEDNGVIFSLSEDNHSIDPVLGYSGRAAPWLAIILAGTPFDEYGPQVIAAQPVIDEEDIWVAVINKKARKEI
ncbi:hypothetical protein ACQYRI_13300 [Salmonella enterica]